MAKNVHQRLAEAMGEVSYIQKEEKKGMNYKIVSHDKVTALVRPALLKAGIVYYPVRCVPSHEGNRASCEMTVRFVNVDEPSDFFDVPTFGYGIDPQDKGPGKAMSYAVKYALLKALGLETGDDPDQDNLPYEPPAKAQPKPKAPAFDPGQEAARILRLIPECRDMQGLLDVWSHNREEVQRIKAADPATHEMMLEAFKARKAKLTVPLPPQMQEAVDEADSLQGVM